jgi:exopolysaccharide biosynthesis polyprenyl glycosylphosphotransferase
MTTTDLPRLGTVSPERLDVPRPAAGALLRPRRSVAPSAMVGADVAAAAVTALVGAWALPVRSPGVLLSLVVAWPLAAALAGCYPRALGLAPAVGLSALLRAAGLAALTSWSVVAVAPDLLPGSGSSSGMARSVLLLVALLLVLSVPARLVARRLGSPVGRQVVLVGDPAAFRPLLVEAGRTPARRGTSFEPVALCVPDGLPLDVADLADAPHDLTIWRGGDDLIEMVRAHRADSVVVAPGAGISHAELRRWGAWLHDEGVEMLISAGLRDVTPSRLELDTLGGLRLLRVDPAPIGGLTHRAKAAVDAVVAVLLLALLAPLLVVLAALIRRETPGPALFTQTRVGRHGRLFTVYKLRTMRADSVTVLETLADENEADGDGVLFKIKRDPRITPLGAVLRRYSLDELPQLINVVRGEMSLIGPRPALPSEAAAYSADLRRRLEVRPGMTGLWQVSGRSDLSWEETVRLDLVYVDNWSWGLDGSIAVRTVGAVLGHRGAY